MSQRLSCMYCGADLTRELYLKNIEKKTTQELNSILGLHRRDCLLNIYLAQEIPFYFGMEMKQEEKKEDLIFRKKS
jgi:hypothetical protein